MAVAGLQNVSVLDSTFHRQSQSPLSSQCGNRNTRSTRASSLLQMWREIEGEHVVSHPQLRGGDRLRHQRIDNFDADLVNGYLPEKQDNDDGGCLDDCSENANECRTWSQGEIWLQNEHEDSNSSNSEQSIDFGEIERGRVRQIFQEWMNSGLRTHSSNMSSVNSYSTAQWLGENECVRERIIRERVCVTSQQGGARTGGTEEHPTEIGDQNERVCDGYFGNHPHAIGSRRKIRRLCGRQALVDLLAKADQERRKELQNLVDYRPVSDFAHRNRIQSLLRGRFLHSGRLVQDERPSSIAASELGLLRQRHTVSGLREGFLSKLDHTVLGPSSCDNSDILSNNDINDVSNEQTQTNSSHYQAIEDLDTIQEQSDPSNADLEGNTGQELNWQEANAPEEPLDEVRDNDESGQLQSSNFLSVVRRGGIGENVGGDWRENITNIAWSQETSENKVEEHHVGPHEELHEQFEPSEEERDMPISSSHTDSEDGDWSRTYALVQQWHESDSSNEDSDWQQADTIELPGWIDVNEEGTDGNRSDITANHWHEEILGSEGEEYNEVQELHEVFNHNSLQEAMDTILELPSAREAAPIGRFDTFYTQDDDNVYSSEIRELLNRRSVSNLLHSDFRQSLDHLIQSYAERQAHASADWGLDEASLSPSSPTLMEQDVPQSGIQNQGQSNAVVGDFVILPSPPVTSSQPFWDQDLQDDNWPQNNLHQRLGIEWEIINDLRIDMARLHQRMNNMQRMLEACMDMQLELQRTVRQEVSAALNRSAGSTDGDYSSEMDESKWDHVRKGLCCICCDNSIDSLLYRCGHMCTCSKCADKLVQGRGKCPMCQAPVVETIRAYFVQ